MADPATFASIPIVQTMHGLMDMFSAGAYVAGLGMGVQAALKLKEHNESPGRVPIQAPVILAGVSGMLLALPTLLFTAPMGMEDPQAASAQPKTQALGKGAETAKTAVLAGEGQEHLALAKESVAQEARDKASEAAVLGEQKALQEKERLARAESDRKAALAKARFEAAERSAAEELASKGLGSPVANSGSRESGDGSALAFVLSTILGVGVAGLAWARLASKRMRRERDAEALPSVNLNGGGSQEKI